MAQKTPKSLSSRGRFWLKHVQQWQRSEATQVQYCQKHKVSVAAFRWWKRRLIPNHAEQALQTEASTAPETTFTEILVPRSSDAAAYPYEITLPNQAQLRLRRDFDAAAVCALVSLLVTTC